MSLKKLVQQGYAQALEGKGSCCPPGSCCGASTPFGCGSPLSFAVLKEGEAVLDLGAGTGEDCLEAAREVGEKGFVVGVDFTPQMVARARENAEKQGCRNVHFVLGEIEKLPFCSGYFDLVISNCVINLSPEKEAVFGEAFRVLKPGGRLVVADTVLLKPLPEETKNSPAAYVACVAGASPKEAYLEILKKAGFKEVEVLREEPFPAPFEGAEGVVSLNLLARKT